jgi:hypothetical protein
MNPPEPLAERQAQLRHPPSRHDSFADRDADGTMARVRRLLLMIAYGALAACSPHSSADGMDGGTEVVLLPYPPDGSAVTWDGWAGAFVRDYCVQCHSPTAPCGGSGCHSPGDPRTPDFENKSAVVGLAPTIQCGISVHQSPAWGCGSIGPKSFPVFQGSNPLPTDEQRDIVVGWVDAGCP